MKKFIKCLTIYLVTISMVHANLPPTTLKGQSDTLKPVNFNFEVPNYQSTKTGSSTGLIETGNNNELVNPSFEHSTVAYGWSIANGASSSSPSAIAGKKANSIALSGALEFYQEIATGAAQKSGVQMVASVWVNSSDVSDLQLCSLKNGSEDKCTVSGGYVQGSGWRQLSVSFLGDSTSNGLKLKSTDTTGTVLVDQAYVGIGSPIVDFTPDNVYSAEISSTGVVSNESTDFISGNCTNASPAVCTFTSSIFTVQPNCTMTPQGNTADMGSLNPNGTTGFNVQFNLNNKFNFRVICQKQGADYKTSKAYVASSSDPDWIPCTFSTLAWQGLGTVTNNLYCKRSGGDLKIRGSFTAGTTTTNIGQIPLPSNFGSLTVSSSVASATSFGTLYTGVAAVSNLWNALAVSSSGYFTVAGPLVSSATNPTTAVNGSFFLSSSATAYIYGELSIPIQGWQDSGVIVGSFQGYNETPGVSAPKLYSFSVSSSGVISNEMGDVVNGNASISDTSLFTINFNSGKFTSGPNCTVTPQTGTLSAIAQIDGVPLSSAVSVRTINSPSTRAAYGFMVICHGF